MNELWERLQIGAEQIGSVVPALAGAAVILLTGYFLARQVQRWADDTLKRVDFNRVAAAGGLDEVVGRTGSRLDPVRALAKLIFWLVMLVVILLASTALGLESINQMFGMMLSFIPTLIAAIVIIILGMIMGEFVRSLILASAGGVAGVPTVAKIAKGAVILIADLHGAAAGGRGGGDRHRGVHPDPGRRGPRGGPRLRAGEPRPRGRDHPPLVRRGPAPGPAAHRSTGTEHPAAGRAADAGLRGEAPYFTSSSPPSSSRRPP